MSSQYPERKRKTEVIASNVLKNAERAVFALRSLYKKNGYLPFKMSRFEEYDLYVKNKEFLLSDRVITFNDTDGRLLAMKPDVTLSIIKNNVYEKGVKQKVCYNENVYRVSAKTGRFSEIMQSGLECIGDTDIFDLYEVIYLAAKSLSLASENFVLDLSHLGILSKLVECASQDRGFAKEITKFIAEKNTHEAKALLEKYSVSEEYRELIISVISMYGSARDVLPKLEPICKKIGAEAAFSELKLICEMLKNSPFADNIRLDFSVVNDMRYYNGIVFRGFLEGICEGVLSGGEYSALMKKMGKKAGALGFAMYLDLLDELPEEKRGEDVDVLLLYDENSGIDEVLGIKSDLIAKGYSVSLQREIPSDLRYGKICDLRK